MSQFAPVAPPQILKYLDDQGHLGSYHLLLAKETLEAPEVFEDIFKKRPRVRTVFMDNNVAETKGQPLTIKEVAEATYLTYANVVILPDVYLDCDATIESCSEALHAWAEALQSRVIHGWTFMIVPQGKTLEEWIRCAEAFMHEATIGWWGIPRNLTDLADVGTRRRAIEIARALNSRRQIHLLGFSENVVDDILCSRLPGVAGIDSAVPLRAAASGKEFSLLTKLGPRGDWWYTAEPNELLVHNLSLARMMVSS